MMNLDNRFVEILYLDEMYGMGLYEKLEILVDY